MSAQPPQHAWVQREDILSQIVDVLNKPCEPNRDLNCTIINPHGAAGLGKTVLLEQIYERFGADYPVFWIDCDPRRDSPARRVSWHDVVAILRTMPFFDDLTSPSPDGSDSQVTLEAKNLTFTYTRLDPPGDRPTIMLLDHLDDLVCWRWVQDELIRPLVDEGCALIACASRSPLSWHFWELRDRCEVQPLELFTLDQTRQLFAGTDYDLLALPAYEFTCGHPKLLAAVLQIFQQAGEIAEHAMLTPGGIPNLNETTQTLLPYIGVLRHAQVETMWQILDTFVPGWHSDAKPIAALHQALQELSEHGYYERAFPPRFRIALRSAAEQIMRSNQSDRYWDLCAWLEGFYFQQFQEKPIDEVSTFAEWLYFSTKPFAERRGGRDRWVARLRQSLERAATLRVSTRPEVHKNGELLSGRRLIDILIQWVYKDGEILNQLRASDLLSTLRELMQAYQGNQVSDTLMLKSAERARLLSGIFGPFEQLAHTQALIAELDMTFGQLLRIIDQLGPEFDVETLFAKLSEINSSIKRGAMIYTRRELEQHGILEYDDKARRYRMSCFARAIISETPLIPSFIE